MSDEELPWDPDRVIPRPAAPKPREKAPLSEEELAERERFQRYWDRLTPEQRRARADRFTWKPGDLREVRGPLEQPKKREEE